MSRIVFGRKPEFLKFLDLYNSKKRYHLYFVKSTNQIILFPAVSTRNLSTAIFTAKEQKDIDCITAQWKDLQFEVDEFDLDRPRN